MEEAVAKEVCTGLLVYIHMPVLGGGALIRHIHPQQQQKPTQQTTQVLTLRLPAVLALVRHGGRLSTKRLAKQGADAAVIAAIAQAQVCFFLFICKECGAIPHLHMITPDNQQGEWEAKALATPTAPPLKQLQQPPPTTTTTDSGSSSKGVTSPTAASASAAVASPTAVGEGCVDGGCVHVFVYMHMHMCVYMDVW